MSLGKAKTTKPTTTVATTLCVALYPSAYDSSQGTQPLCAANYDQARRDRDGHDTTEPASGHGMPGTARTVSSNTASLERPTGTRSATPPRRQAVATTRLGTRDGLVVGKDNLKINCASVAPWLDSANEKTGIPKSENPKSDNLTR